MEYDVEEKFNNIYQDEFEIIVSSMTYFSSILFDELIYWPQLTVG